MMNIMVKWILFSKIGSKIDSNSFKLQIRLTAGTAAGHGTVRITLPFTLVSFANPASLLSLPALLFILLLVFLLVFFLAAF